MVSDLSLSLSLSASWSLSFSRDLWKILLSLRPRPQQWHARNGTKQHLKLSRSSPRHTRTSVDQVSKSPNATWNHDSTFTIIINLMASRLRKQAKNSSDILLEARDALSWPPFPSSPTVRSFVWDKIIVICCCCWCWSIHSFVCLRLRDDNGIVIAYGRGNDVHQINYETNKQMRVNRDCAMRERNNNNNDGYWFGPSLFTINIVKQEEYFWPIIFYFSLHPLDAGRTGKPIS